MVLKIEQLLGSKNCISTLRQLVLKPYLSYGLTQLSRETGVSKSNILRIMEPLVKNKIVLEINEKRKKVYKINHAQQLNEKLFEMFMLEKQSMIAPEQKNIIDMFFNKVKNNTKLFILFGSVAHNLQKKSSDIDICIVGNKTLKGLNFDYNQHKIEMHNYCIDDFKNIKDFVVLESLLNGIWYKGQVFQMLSNLKSVPKAYMIYRLNQAKEFIKKSEKLEKNAKKYFLDIGKTTLAEIDSIFSKKTTISRRKIEKNISIHHIKQLEEKLAVEGECIWII